MNKKQVLVLWLGLLVISITYAPAAETSGDDGLNWARVVLSQQLTNYSKGGTYHIHIAAFDDVPLRDIHIALTIVTARGGEQDANLCALYFNCSDDSVRRRAIGAFIALKRPHDHERWISVVLERKEKHVLWFALYQSGWQEAYFTDEDIEKLLKDGDEFIRNKAKNLRDELQRRGKNSQK